MDCFIGTIQLFSYSIDPEYWLPCDGALLEIKTNQALFALLETRFGGNGTTTFKLPDLRSAAIGSYNKYYICTQGIFPVRN